MKFVVKKVFRTKKLRKEWMWTLFARNGRVIATSGKESYQNQKDCLDTINLIKGSSNRAVVEIIGGEKGKTNDQNPSIN